MGHWWGIAAGLAGVLVAPACGASVFECLSTDDCAGQAGGSCEASGYCSFPDDTCASGRRYGEYAPAAFSEVCVDPGAGSSSSAGATDSASGDVTTDATTDVTTDTSGPEPSGADASSGRPTTVALTLSSTTTDATDSTGESDASQTGDTASTGGPSLPATVLVFASVAACTDPLANDPLACELGTDTQGMSVDTSNDAAMLQPTTAYVAFDLSDVGAELPPDAQLSGVELRLTTTDDPNAESMTQTGEIWQTAPFTEASLSMGQPALVGDMAVAADQGGVASSQLVTWIIPNAELDGQETLYLAVVPTTPEGVDYWNALGIEPPVLALEFTDGR